ncbi:hypothetical protein [Blastochloris tepida]|uniref:Uncharacterized protein n=1 Tax=Blastochloris tepida TaxID=2233851 RepID=A0A348G1C6_9HYPH|nr:hypothetical protein [Blastochloris tepida]BBF93359.1 hypothetical protein BLTE_20440 [Blastochloris tepida]
MASAARSCARHRWGEPQRTTYETVRTCQRCGLERVTRHEPDRLPWVEFRAQGVTAIGYRGTPPCVPRREAGPTSTGVALEGRRHG